MDSPADQSIAEYINQPSSRQVASFFLGFVFITCIHYTYHVPITLTRRIVSRILGRRRSLHGHRLDANRLHYGDEKVHDWLEHETSVSSSTSESNSLALSLTICFAMASVAQFGSLLVFSTKNREGGQAGCAFLVAWSGLAGQAARLLGLLKLSLDLKKMGATQWECFVLWGWLVFGLVLMFVSNAISIGTIKTLPQMTNFALCYRRHFLPMAVATSAVDVIVEVYCLARITFLLVPPFLSLRHKLDAMLDVRTFRVFSLLMLDLATALPAAKSFGVLVDVIPASIATLLVLAAFNRRSPNVYLATTASIPPTTRPESLRSRSTIEIKKLPSAHSLRDRALRVSHPFAAQALEDLSPETEDWPETAVPVLPVLPEKPYLDNRRKTWQSGVSESDSEIARSVKGAVVSFAFKDNVGRNRSKQREQSRRSFLPSIPSSSGSSSLPEAPPEVPTPPRSHSLNSATQARATKPIQLKPEIINLDEASGKRKLVAQPEISVTSATPVKPAAAPKLPSTPSSKAPSSKTPSFSITLPTNYTESSKSLHLTPTTPAHPRSHRASAESSFTGEWRYDPRHDSSGSSHRSGSEDSTEALRLQTGVLPPADDDLSIVYEASHEDSESIPPSRAYRPTFGEHMFVQGGLGGPPPIPPDVPQDVHPEENGSGGSTKSLSLSHRT